MDEDANEPPVEVEGASVGNLLVVLHAAKNEILQEIQMRYEELLRELSERIDAMSATVVHKVISGVSSYSNLGRGTTSRSRSSSEKKRKAPPPPERLRGLDTVLEKDKTQFVVQWSMIVTLMSFAQANPSLLPWVPRAAREQLAAQAGVLQEASGISTLFFSVESDQKWSLYHGKIGKLWSLVLRCSISSSLLNIRRTFFQSGTVIDPASENSIPLWLDSFGGKQKTYGIVSEILSCLETTDEMARVSGNIGLLSRRKRMRLEGEKPGDEFEAERDFCVSQIRTLMLRNWSYGRAEARKVFTGEVLFLVDKIRGYPSIEAARADGYEIAFGPPSHEETTVPQEVTGTVWDIPLAATKGGTDDELFVANSEKLLHLEQRFPGLHVTLRYKRAVLRLAAEAGGANTPSFWPVEERVSLHNLALTILTSSLSAKSSRIVLQTSGLSLRAIHVLAIGLRGLLRQCLKLELSELEKCALGGLTCDGVSKDNAEKVSVISSSRQGKGSSNLIQQARDEKLTMSLAAYREEWERSRAALASHGGSSRSEGAQADHDIDGDEDLDEDFLEG